MILLDKFGKEFRNPKFYAEKYIKAFDVKVENTLFEFADNPKRTYIVRSFDRFLNYFGFTEFNDDGKNPSIKKTKVFNELIKIRAHRKF